MVKHGLKIGHLYPKEMNIYGDTGNVLVLQKRIERRGIGAEIVKIGIGDKVPKDIDILVSGGGQDAGQVRVQEDLISKGEDLRQYAQDGMVMIVICGTYQLFGKRFITKTERVVKGIGLLNLETIAGDARLIGNITTNSPWGTLVGYENHSGRTFLGKGLKPLGKVLAGAGNNGEDQSEGAIFKNVFGSYLHGPILPKNPHLADELIQRAMVRKYGKTELADLDDHTALRASQIAEKRPR